jgi:hypothetical protein
VTDAVSIVAIVASALLFLAGLVDIATSWTAAKATAVAIQRAATTAQQTNESAATLEAQSATDFKGAWEALASLASALKDLDRSTRLLVLALAFLAVAATASGLGELATALGG